MGGYGSGRTGGSPVADTASKIDLAWMLRNGRAKEGGWISGTLSWSWNDGSPAGSIGYKAIMDQPGMERLELRYTLTRSGKKEEVEQTIRLTFTEPHYGGKRWWMICPYQNCRVGKLYLPGGGDRFASRKAWRLGYRSQRVAHNDRPFEKLFRLQKKLGCDQGWGGWIRRPKGMHQKTFDRLEARFEEIDAQCNMSMVGVMERLTGRIDSR